MSAQPESSRRRSRIVPQHEAGARLAELGVLEQAFERSILVGDSARQRVSGRHYPCIYPGVTMWTETLAALRQQLIKLRTGWKIGRTGNYETVYNEELRIAIAVVAGDSQTGMLHGREPKLTRKRGPKTAERINRNRQFVQLELQFDLSKGQSSLSADEACRTWFLVVHASTHEVRIELSLARKIGEDGLVSDWVERILMPPVPITGAVEPIDSDDEDEGDDGDYLVTRH